MSYVLFFDGSSRGNPGRGGCGFSLELNNEEIYYGNKFLGDNITNNESEYLGLLEGLKYIKEQNIQNITIKGDSKLVIEQMKCNWQCKANNLKKYYKECLSLIKDLEIEFLWIPRKENSRADELANL